ncbi:MULTISPECIES: phytanoyl-CoA dioxygenase family protein [Paraburkholderia]|uniref:phytanoyl-CoA dioxygenase family protein n=1 Tax=Paraburkholderia TaxID=1822464 RepID=UPI00224E15A8|nr:MULTISPECIES: phytanoyl-CoA dioxygenase family protein [Paraburkholderia]MCX4162789.1 phytanoyl-CoA dioxygenase family protein [Paraburkholderia megapolitana]MDN7158284.1 phytanoyl-CoA dioxygenase family protein [Paraburkholderia sp. CHISQ3]MDQ6495331.1 phytanoyl-CoA dioxygenase family protein [Paraburkholderia megapolitana]
MEQRQLFNDTCVVQPASRNRSPLDAFIEDGYCTFPSPFSRDELDLLRRNYMKLLDLKMRRLDLRSMSPHLSLLKRNDAVLNDFKPAGGNHDLNRWNMHLPSHGSLFDERIFNDTRVMQVVNRLIGPKAVCYLIASDTPLAGAGFQGAHQDFTRFSIALNIPLVDVTNDNGPTEVWPGTHRNGEFDTRPYFIPADDARALSVGRRPVRLTVPAGTLIVRDHRLLHRGSANLTPDARPMLSIYYVLAGDAPYGWLAQAGVWLAARVREIGRGKGGSVASQRLLNLGNLLGRLVEETSHSDRDYRRAIEARTFARLSPRARHLLRYARIVSDGVSHPQRRGTLRGSNLLIRRWFGACMGFLMQALRHTPRRPD